MQKGVSRTNLPHTMAWYSTHLGLPVHCVNDYRRRGYPLENPPELLRLILVHRQGRKPPSLERLQALAAEGAPEPAKVNGNGNGKRVNGNGRHQLPFPPVSDLNDGQSPIRRQAAWIEAEVERVRVDYLQEEHPADRFHKFRILQGLIQTYHKLSRAVRNIEFEAANCLDRSEVAATWSRFVKAHRARFEGWPARVASNPMFRKIDPEAVEQLLKAECEELLKLFDTDPLG